MNPLNHVAIIMDGNGRWGLKHKNSRNEGHRAGLNTIENILKETIKQKIKFITLFTFSTENWKRPKKEIKYLFKLLENFLLNKIENLNKKNIKLKIIGYKNFSPELNKILRNSEKLTEKNHKILFNSKVVKIKKETDCYSVQLENGDVHFGKHIMTTMPLAHLPSTIDSKPDNNVISAGKNLKFRDFLISGNMRRETIKAPKGIKKSE